MILECTTCHARFKVADEKIGPRGSKVRCGRCKAVFVVQKPADAAPGGEVGLALDDAGSASAVPLPSSQAGAPAAPRSPIQDPFAPSPSPQPAAVQDPFAPGPPARPVPAQDPFAVQAPPLPKAADPFAPPQTRGPFSPGLAPAVNAAPAPERTVDPLVDPFVAAGAASSSSGPDPFAPATSLPVTDLSDLAGPAPAPAPSPAPPAAAKPPSPSVAAPPPKPAAVMPPPLPGSSGSLSLEEGDHAGGHPGGRGGVGELDFGFSGRFDAMDEAAPELEVGPAHPSPPAATSGGRPGDLLDGLPEAPSLELAMPAPAPAPAPPPPAPAPAPVRSSPARAAAEPAPAAEQEPAESSGAGQRTAIEGLRPLLLNSLSLVLVLLVSVALLAIWRQGRVDASAFRLNSVRAALGAGSKEVGAVATSGVANGFYDTMSGWRVLFVRGEVVSRSAAPLGPVKIRVEVSEDERVVAKAEALAGAVPTAEDLWALTGPGDLEKLSAGLASRAERVTRPGTSTPFVVMFPELPRDLSRMVFRVIVEPAPAAN